jgi:hypothetical protein
MTSSPQSSLASPTSSTSASSPTPASSATRTRKRVSAEHTLTRVRENQRRHRARRKDYIATLEEKLAETEQQLAAARAEIEDLTREREGGIVVLPCVHGGAVDDGGHEEYGQVVRRDSAMDEERGVDVQIGVDVQNTPTPDEPIEEMALSQPSTALPSVQPDTDTFYSTFYTFSSLPSPHPTPTPLDLSLEHDIDLAGPPPCCEDPPAITATATTTAALPLSSDPECSTCKTRPAPLPSESTTLCAQAYVMISQQNFRDVDAATIRLWLYQGYRRAQRQGEGCRVENGALFRLLDFISGI